MLKNLSRKLGASLGALFAPPRKQGKKSRGKIALNEIRMALSGLSGWSISSDRIAKEFGFADFATALMFMNRCALEIHKLDHHPEWTNIYGRVFVELTTHEAGGITAKDIELAKLMDTIAATLSPTEKIF